MTIHPFPKERIVRIPKPEIKRRKDTIRLMDLGGTRPQGHPKLSRGKRGKALIAVGQVWVEIHNDHLWVVRELRFLKADVYPHLVTLERYNRTDYRQLSERTMRSVMSVWDDLHAFKQALVEKVVRASVCDPKSPFKKRGGGEAALRFFGLNKNGDRVD